MGDWSLIVRDPSDLLRATMLIGAIATSLDGDTESAVRFVITFVLLLGVRALQLPRPFDFGFVLGMMFQAWGNALNLFLDVSWYDKVVHFVLPFFTAPAVYLLLARLEVVPDLAQRTEERHNVGIVIVSFSLGMTVGAIYEIYEWFANHELGAHLQVGYGDTISDLTDDALGSLGGALLLLVWTTRGWATSRRIPERMLRGWHPRRAGSARR